MARVPQVTRTITTTKCTLLCVDTVNGEAFNDSIIVPRTYSDEKKLLKVVKELYNTDEHEAVKVVATETIETLYGMTEAEFIAVAKVLPPRTAQQNSDNV